MHLALSFLIALRLAGAGLTVTQHTLRDKRPHMVDIRELSSISKEDPACVFSEASSTLSPTLVFLQHGP